jgi:predicted nucleotidyltransferase component of viral defense system
MNKARLTALCHKISKEYGLTFNSVMLHYFLESILKKIVQGKYGENLVFKGGFLLSNVVGIESRSTMDIDFLIRNLPVSEEKVSEMLAESLKEKEGDEIHHEILDISPIKEQDQYEGYRARILCKFDNIRQVVPLDIATGDVITPHSIQYSYVSVFGDDKILIKAYPIETMLAEKLHTIYTKGFLNSRNKDYYDLHILYKLKRTEIDMPTLARACERTFHHRKTEFDVEKLLELLERLKQDDSFLNRWKAYSKKNSYVQGISFKAVILDAMELINNMVI